MSSQDGILVLEVAPTPEYISPYLDYVAAQGSNSANSYRPHPDLDPNELFLAGQSVEVGRACELARLCMDKEADLRLGEASDRLSRFIDGPNRPDPETRRTAILLRSMAGVVIARRDPDDLNEAYTSMRTHIVQDAVDYRQMASQARSSNRRGGRDTLDGSARAYTGFYPERTELGMLAGCRGLFVMPALPHHDWTSNRAASHDEVLIAKQAFGSMSEDDEANSSLFLTQIVQVKSFCLALCPAGPGSRRVKGSASRLQRERDQYYTGTALSSTHCDLGDPGSGLETAVARLNMEMRHTLGKELARDLRQTRTRLVGRLLAPTEQRMGRRRLAADKRSARVIPLAGNTADTSEVTVRFVATSS